MVRGCNGRCITHPMPGQKGRTRDMYKLGKIYCRTCEYSAFYDGVWCHCCNNRVKHNPASNRVIETIKVIRRI